ncbi:MAG TPA: DUF3570 domain-containing protein [Burkholderiales bacterium]|nr:DUF3570 domain-containing protein [Burkholderiales bacterium]
MQLTMSVFKRRLALAVLGGAGLLGFATQACAGVLPEDRADLLYHRYQGGGITIDGPSVLIRKKIGEKFSVAANYYQDMVSSASIDVQLSASKYEETRKQKSISFDYLRGKATYSAGVIDSKESDYVADTAYFALSQDMFGDLTTISLSYKRGWNDVFRNVKLADGSKVRDDTFRDGADTRGYSVGLSQILTRNLILALNYEVITDEGFLNSPYRSVRFATPGGGFSLEREIYPRTHTSNAVSARLKYYLPYRAAVEGSYRFFTDTWGVVANNVEISYTQPAFRRWNLDGRVRYYKQRAADFYSDLFPRSQSQNFEARDKELATFDSIAVGVGASYEFTIPRVRWVQKSTINARIDHLTINYDDFRDATKNDPANGIVAGAEPLYKLNANVFELFVSIWF